MNLEEFAALVATSSRRLPFRISVVSLALLAAVVAMQFLPASAAQAQGGNDCNNANGNVQTCRTLPLPGNIVLGDSSAIYSSVGGHLDGNTTIAWKVEGEFPHATTVAFTGYDDFGLIPGAEYVLNDKDIIPDKNSENPWIPGTPVNVENRSYTVWIWPDTVPVPKKLENVVLYPTVARDPEDERVRVSVVIRYYEMWPGISPIREQPTVTRYDTSNLKRPLDCDGYSGLFGALALVDSFGRQVDVFGAGVPPQPWKVDKHSNKIAFSRIPAELVPVPEGYPADGAVNYLAAIVDASKISTLTLHRTGTFYNNQNLPWDAIFGEYEARYMSFVNQAQFPVRSTDVVNQNQAIYQDDGSWVTVVLPSLPQLSDGEVADVRAKAAELGYNVIGGGRYQPNVGLEPGLVAFRMQRPADGFEGSNLNVPSWTEEGNNYSTYNEQSSDEFFETFTSTPHNMGEYWLDGVTETLKEFLDR